MIALTLVFIWIWYRTYSIVVAIEIHSASRTLEFIACILNGEEYS